MAQWFKDWFNSPYYHQLYYDRDDTEAAQFISLLLQYLQPKPNSYLLDVACGKGRHAKIMNALGHIVTGIDIAPDSIAEAQQYATDTLEFYEADMRQTFRVNYYHYVFNLFTSFGYFSTSAESNAALRTMAQALLPKGYLVIDYLNSSYIAQHLVATETKVINDSTYTITRQLVSNRFVKNIAITNNMHSQPLQYTEQVSAYTLANFETMLAKQGLAIQHLFGSYTLQPFNINESKRLIIIAQKL